MDNAKTQAYEQHFKPLVEQLHALAEQHKINFVCMFDIRDDETSTNRVINSCHIDTKVNGMGVHAIACNQVANGSPQLAAAVAKAAHALKLLEEVTDTTEAAN